MSEQESLDPRSAVQQAAVDLRQEIQQRLRQSSEELLHLVDAFAANIPEPEPEPESEPEATPEPDAPPPAAAGSFTMLRDALAQIDAADSQAEVLARLLEQATAYASRAALFLSQEGSTENLRGWSGIGFENGAAGLEGLELDLQPATPWPAVLDGRGTLLLTAADCAPLCSRIETPLPRKGTLVPLVLRDRVEAVLYGDQLSEDPFSVEALQVLAHAAAQALEILPLRQRPQSPTFVLADATAPVATPAPPPPVETKTQQEALTEELFEPTAEAAPRPTAEEPTEPVAAAPEPTPVTPPEPTPPAAPPEPPAEEAERPTLSTAPVTTAAPTEPPAVEPPSVEPAEPSAAGLSAGERAAGFSMESLEGTEPSEAPTPAPPAPSRPELVDAGQPEAEEEGWELESTSVDLEPSPELAAPPSPPAAPQPPQPPQPPPAPTETARLDTANLRDLQELRETPPAAPPPQPPAAPMAEPPEPAEPTDIGRDTQLISALSEPPVAPTTPQAAPPQPPPAPPAPPVDEATVGSGEVVPPADIDGPGWAFSDKPAAAPAGEEPLHDEARRLARLLVSEIKLYNEELIAEGKRKGNIYQELREDIDRSRQMYEERIDERVRGSSDYFREELIRSLAGGDASVMGM